MNSPDGKMKTARHALALILFFALAAGAVATSQHQAIELVSPNQLAQGEFGVFAAGVPDMDGDGRGDVVVCAHVENRAYLFNGATGTLIHTLHAPNQAEPGHFGVMAAGLSDVNGDSFGDVVVGADYATSGSAPANAGMAYIFSGADGQLLHSLISPNAQADGFFGRSLARLPDVDGDGFDDIVIGAPKEDPEAGLENAGQVYVFSGASGKLLQEFTSPNAEADGLFGVSVAGAPDVNGDGLGEVVVGAWHEDPGASPDSAGRSYVFDGATSAVLHTLASPNEQYSGVFGLSVSGIPDVNGDNRGDVVVSALLEESATGPTDAGRVYVFDGAQGNLLHTLVSPSEEPFAYFGRTVTGLPDVTGDGRGEVAVGARYENPGQSPLDSGRVHIYDGASGRLLRTLASPNAQTNGWFCRVSSVPDTNHDGQSDLVVGAWGESLKFGPERAGRAYIFTNLIPVTGARFWRLFGGNIVDFKNNYRQK